MAWRLSESGAARFWAKLPLSCPSWRVRTKLQSASGREPAWVIAQSSSSRPALRPAGVNRSLVMVWRSPGEKPLAPRSSWVLLRSTSTRRISRARAPWAGEAVAVAVPAPRGPAAAVAGASLVWSKCWLIWISFCRPLNNLQARLRDRRPRPLLRASAVGPSADFGGRVVVGGDDQDRLSG